MSIDVLAIGESLGLLVPERTGHLAYSRELRLGFGGAESNVAIAASRLGARAAWCGRVGDDDLGELITRELRAERVDVAVVVDSAAPTAMMLKQRPRPGETRIIYYRTGGAGSRLMADDTPAGLIERSRVLHVTGISAGLGEGPLAALHAAIDRACDAGVTVSFDVNHRSGLWNGRTGAVDAYRSLVERSDIVFAGDDEAALVTGEQELDSQLWALRAMGPKCVVIKRGEAGAVALAESPAGELRVESAAIPVDVVDTVGAGDAFVAGWLAEQVRGLTLRECMATAIACGAFACTGEGDWETSPTRSDLERLQRPAGEPVQR